MDGKKGMREEGRSEEKKTAKKITGQRIEVSEHTFTKSANWGLFLNSLR